VIGAGRPIKRPKGRVSLSVSLAIVGSPRRTNTHRELKRLRPTWINFEKRYGLGNNIAIQLKPQRFYSTEGIDQSLGDVISWVSVRLSALRKYWKGRQIRRLIRVFFFFLICKLSGAKGGWGSSG
jgi:hypothetical protein